jgi:hypothetical protein
MPPFTLLLTAASSGSQAGRQRTYLLQQLLVCQPGQQPLTQQPP